MNKHIWIKANGHGYFCAVCGCERKTRPIIKCNNKHQQTYYNKDGQEYIISPKCKKI